MPASFDMPSQNPGSHQPMTSRIDNVPLDPDQSNRSSQYWTLDEILDRLINLAEPEEKPVLQKIFGRLRKDINAKT